MESRSTDAKLEDLKRKVAALAKPRLLDGECERIKDLVDGQEV